MKYIILIFLATTISSNAWLFQDVTLEELSGTWEHYHVPNVLNVFPDGENDGVSIKMVCKQEFTYDCLASFDPGKHQYTIDADNMKYTRVISGFPSNYYV